MANFVGTTNLGNTEIHGNFNIENQNTNINSTQVTIKDNIITLNSEEASDKVSAGKAGIEINRGSSPKYSIVFDEADSGLKIGFENDLNMVATQEYVDNALSLKAGEILDAEY